MRTATVVVVYRDGWKIVVNGEAFGPYPTEEEAVVVARRWAENAAKQGHRVGVLIKGGKAVPKETAH